MGLVFASEIQIFSVRIICSRTFCPRTFSHSDISDQDSFLHNYILCCHIHWSTPKENNSRASLIIVLQHSHQSWCKGVWLSCSFLASIQFCLNLNLNIVIEAKNVVTQDICVPVYVTWINGLGGQSRKFFYFCLMANTNPDNHFMIFSVLEFVGDHARRGYILVQIQIQFVNQENFAKL